MKNHNMDRYTYFRSLVAAIGILGSANNAAATDYLIDFDVNTNGVYDDNFRLTDGDEITLSGAEVAPKLLFGASTEQQKFNFASRLRSARYDDDQFDTDDQFATIDYSYQFERSSVGLNADFVRDSTNTSEIVSSGRISNQAERHTRYALSPSWTYALNESNSLTLNARYSKDNYDGRGYIGYDNLQSNLDWNYLINERWSLMARASFSRFETEDRSFFLPYYIIIDFGGGPQAIPIGITEQSSATTTKSNGALLGVKYIWSEQQTLTLLVGSSHQKTEYSLKDPEGICGQYFSALCVRENQSGSSLTLDGSWTWQSERNQLELSATKSTQPTSDGEAVDQSQLTGSWRFSLTELQKLAVILQAVRNRELSDSDANVRSALNRDYESATIEYAYQLTEYWSVNASYRYRTQEYPDFDNSASGQTVSLGVRYHPQQWHWSR